MKSSELSIGELAARFGLATHVLRHWESVGLLSPARRVSGRRRYGQRQLTAVAFILAGKEAGLGLEQLRELITIGEPKARRALLQRHHAELGRRIAAATASQEMIEVALNCPHEDYLDCPNFHAELAARIPAAR